MGSAAKDIRDNITAILGTQKADNTWPTRAEGRVENGRFQAIEDGETLPLITINTVREKATNRANSDGYHRFKTDIEIEIAAYVKVTEEPGLPLERKSREITNELDDIHEQIKEALLTNAEFISAQERTLQLETGRAKSVEGNTRYAMIEVNLKLQVSEVFKSIVTDELQTTTIEFTGDLDSHIGTAKEVRVERTP